MQRTRIAKGINDFGVFLPQTPHFAIGINSPQGSTIKQHCAERDKTNPILLIYVIDKNSGPQKGDNSIRARLGTKDDIIAFAIGLPLATLTSWRSTSYALLDFLRSRSALVSEIA